MQSPADRTEKKRELMSQLFGPRPAGGGAGEQQPGAEHLRLLTDVIFGEVWSRPGLETRERSMCTLAALIVLNREPELRLHLRGALHLGITREQILEIILQMAFYGGAPTGVAALRVAREVFGEQDGQQGKR